MFIHHYYTSDLGHVPVNSLIHHYYTSDLVHVPVNREQCAVAPQVDIYIYAVVDYVILDDNQDDHSVYVCYKYNNVPLIGVT